MANLYRVLFLIIVLAICAWFIEKYLRNRGLMTRSIVTRVTTSDLIAFLGLIIASITYYDAQESGPKMQAALDSTTNALKSVVIILNQQKSTLNTTKLAIERSSETALKQQELLDSSISIAQNQLTLLQTQWNEQKKNLARKPKIKFQLWDFAVGRFVSEDTTKTKFNLIPVSKNREVIGALKVINEGNINLLKPAFSAMADPPNVYVASYGNDYLKDFPSYYIDKKQIDVELPPFKDTGMSMTYHFTVRIPEGIKDFEIKFQVLASNAPYHEVPFKFKVVEIR